jgi:hypothetical protein
MRFPIPVLTLAVGLGLVAVGTPPARAIDEEILRFNWICRPESTRPHPKKEVLAYVITEKHQLYDITIAYSLKRRPFWGDLPKPGGKVIVNLKILQDDRTLDFGTVTRKVHAYCNGYCKGAEVRWTDPSGHEVRNWTDQLTDLLPLRLEPGDVVMWTVRFRKFPKIVRGTASEEDHLDEVGLWALHSNCGTMNRRCPPN